MASAPASFPASQAASRRGGGWAMAGILIAALLSSALLLMVVGDLVFAAAFLAGVLGTSAVLAAWGRARSNMAVVGEQAPARADIGLIRAALDASAIPAAVTDSDGALVAANQAYSELMDGAAAPLDLRLDDQGQASLRVAIRDALAGGSARAAGVMIDGRAVDVEISGAGFDSRHLVWRFSPRDGDVEGEALRLISGEAGSRLGEAGVMVVLADGEGRLIGANRAFAIRAADDPSEIAGQSFVSLVMVAEDGQFFLAREGKAGTPVRIIHVALGEEADPPALFLLLDESLREIGQIGQEGANVNALLDILPLGLALANNDGRFVHLNKAFRKAAGLSKDARPAYPADLLVDEDKTPVSDAVWRFARGPSLSSDMAVRLKVKPDEPIALTIAGARGLGEAAVLLSIKDNSEEDRLKRQVAQATKMQAVGQLAGGVAHDFNNILTAIIGYCDLMLMRHTPGDSDYDDIQQIKSNSNRAAGLTRQLLAFSRQQTLRPQVLQLPDVISEVSNLLNRLLDETVTLQVKHDRNLGAVRADPGQLEQVIVNLAVNARDAMPGGGTLTLHTYSVTADDVRKLGSDILPIGEYTALKVSDTGSGIPPAILGKIFEPFFTTKEVGKGTGLGLSTVYGIVKQSGGFIFAESEVGRGTSFVIYLPVHRSEAPRPAKEKAKEAKGELWGTGTILLVEDEAMVRAVAERALTRHGYTVLTAENGEAALEILAREQQIDLIVSDVVMPTMDGPTTVREARKTHPDLPILFMSGYAEEQLRKSIDLERVAFLAKPFSVQKLAESVRDALAQK